MTERGRYHGGLVFFGKNDGELEQFSQIVANTLEDYGHPVERQSRLSTYDAQTAASHYLVQLSLADTGEPSEQAGRCMRLDVAGGLNPGRQIDIDNRARRLTVSLIAADPERDDRDISELLMVVMLYRMVDMSEATFVEWLDPDTVLTTEQFLAAFNDVAPALADDISAGAPLVAKNVTPLKHPGRLRRPNGLANGHAVVAETGIVQLSDQDRLALAFRTDAEGTSTSPVGADAAQSDIRRLAIWGMTGMVATLSAPVAVSMAAVNLIRGEDFRLNTQVLSLTGALVFLQSSGALAQAVSVLPL